jgi:valyl-tRNA synthetase
MYITGSNIIFFWVARMIIMTQEVKNTISFKQEFFHGIVRDENGVKMSKTLGNGIDPMSVIEEYNADILRFTMIYLTPKGHDTNIDMDDFKIGQTFCTKP